MGKANLLKFAMLNQIGDNLGIAHRVTLSGTWYKAAMHPQRFSDKQERTVQRAVKHWRLQEARRIIIDRAAPIAASTVQ